MAIAPKMSINNKNKHQEQEQDQEEEEEEDQDQEESNMNKDQVAANQEDGHEHDMVMPGFRFHPTEEELIEFYLRRKVEGKRFNVELITFLDLYRYDPWELPGLAAIGEKEWYFYVPRDRKYRNGDRPNRVTTSGYWKATGADRMIRSDNSSASIGLKKTLVFYSGKAPKGIRTSWIMNEYRLPHHETERYQKAEISLCRVYKRAGVEDHPSLPRVVNNNNNNSNMMNRASSSSSRGGGGGGRGGLMFTSSTDNRRQQQAALAAFGSHIHSSQQLPIMLMDDNNNMMNMNEKTTSMTTDGSCSSSTSLQQDHPNSNIINDVAAYTPSTLLNSPNFNEDHHHRLMMLHHHHQHHHSTTTSTKAAASQLIGSFGNPNCSSTNNATSLFSSSHDDDLHRLVNYQHAQAQAQASIIQQQQQHYHHNSSHHQFSTSSLSQGLALNMLSSGSLPAPTDRLLWDWNQIQEASRDHFNNTPFKLP